MLVFLGETNPRLSKKVQLVPFAVVNPATLTCGSLRLEGGGFSNFVNWRGPEQIPFGRYVNW